MVRIEENRLIIEIKTSSPIEELVNLQNGLIGAIKNFDSEGSDGMTIYSLTGLLKELIPTFEQNKVLFNS